MIPRFEPTATAGEALAFLARAAAGGRAAGAGVQELETRFAAYHGVPHAAFVPSGRMGLWLILKALGYPAGSEVVVPAFTYFAIPAVIRAAGLVPVYADIDPATSELTPESVAAALTDRTRAVVPTHLFGRTCPMAALEAVCRPRGVDLVEDCAQACGADVAGGKAGARGRAACFTFGITKNYTTFSGAMVLCREEDVRTRVADALGAYRPPALSRLLKEGVTALAMRAATQRAVFSLSLAPVLRAGRPDEPDLVHRVFDEPAHGIAPEAMERLAWRPGDAQARAGLRQLDALDAKNAARRDRGRRLLEALRQAGCAEGLPAPADADGDHIFVSFAIRRPDRYRFLHALRRAGVDGAPGYMSDCSALPALGGRPGRCPRAAEVAATIVHLPLYPGLSPADLPRIAAAVAAADRRG